MSTGQIFAEVFTQFLRATQPCNSCENKGMVLELVNGLYDIEMERNEYSTLKQSSTCLYQFKLHKGFHVHLLKHYLTMVIQKTVFLVEGVQSWRVEHGLVEVDTTRIEPVRNSTNNLSSHKRYTTLSSIWQFVER